MAVLGKTKKEVLQEFRTTEILEAARRVFARLGYNETTIDRIAEEAGIAKGTIYLYFPSKQELFTAAMRNGLNELYEVAQLEITAASTTAGRLRAFIAARLRYCTENRDFFRIYYTEFAHAQVRSSPSQPLFQDLYEQQLSLLESLLKAGVRSGELREMDTRKSAQLIFEYVRGSVAKHVLDWSDSSIDSTLDLVFNLLWNGIQCESR